MGCWRAVTTRGGAILYYLLAYCVSPIWAAFAVVGRTGTRPPRAHDEICGINRGLARRASGTRRAAIGAVPLPIVDPGCRRWPASSAKFYIFFWPRLNGWAGLAGDYRGPEQRSPRPDYYVGRDCGRCICKEGRRDGRANEPAPQDC